MHYEKRAIVLSPRGLSLHVILSQMVNNQSWNFRSQNNSHFRKCRSESQERKLFFSYIKYYLSRYMWFTVRSLEQFRLLSPCFFSRRDQSPTSNRMSISIQRVVSQSTYHVVVRFLGFLFFLLGRRNIGGPSRNIGSRSRSRSKSLGICQIFLDLYILPVFNSNTK